MSLTTVATTIGVRVLVEKADNLVSTKTSGLTFNTMCVNTTVSSYVVSLVCIVMRSEKS